MFACELPRGDYFGMMEVYVDESGIHKNTDLPPKRCVVAGFSGGRRKWLSFEREWVALLVEFGIPACVGFHAKTFFNRDKDGRRRGVYKDWDTAKSEAFLDGLLGIIDTHQLHAIGGAVDLQVFHGLSHNMRCWLTGGIYDDVGAKWQRSGAPNKPYYYAFQQAIVGGAEPASDGVQVDFIFDRQDEFRKYALDMWNTMKDGFSWQTGSHLGRIGFFSRLERIALQAADLLAYCCYHVDAYSANSWNRDIGYCLHRFLKSQRFKVKALDQNTIKLLLPVYPASLRAQDMEGSTISV